MRFVPFFALIALASPALAQNSSAVPQNKEEKKICRATAQTGSILGGKRECHTKAEWAKISEAARNDLDRNDRNMRGRNGGLGASRE
ncbi:MAG: hypothetical protein KF730_14730 [Sphingomonas sp.]|uniref:hypothetical protein n=1 Tax=Sphingomonas sp. TaxID=28214 RepID=UPI0025E0566D|nr:hypothetical protein [Sphingomonas sp.]MBX3565822.1 hypothetical protein [Sphingomonas sp.]